MDDMMTSGLQIPVGPAVSVRVRRLLFVTAWGCAGLGALVIVGWYAGYVPLIQILPFFAPMQFNTALGFLLCGAGLGALVGNRRRLAAWAGGVAIALGGLTLIEYGFGVDLGIDQLLMEHHVTVQTSHPGRMAPNTAVCFVMAGVGTIVAAYGGPRYRMAVMGILGTMTLTLAGAALLGYLLGVESVYGWGRWTRMALHTTLGFMMHGTAMFVLAYRGVGVHGRVYPRWLAASTGIAVMGIAIPIAQLLSTAPAAALQKTHAALAPAMAFEVRTWFEARAQGFVRMARRMERGVVSKESWEWDAGLYLTHQPGNRAIAWVGLDRRVRWMVPEGTAALPVGLPLGDNQIAKEVLDRASESGGAAFSFPLRLASGFEGILLAVPIGNGSRGLGYVVTALQPREALEPVFAELEQQGYAAGLYHGASLLAATPGFDRDTEAQVHTSPVELAGAGDWWIHTVPTPATIASAKSGRPLALLFAGMLVACLVGMVIDRSRSARLSARGQAEQTVLLRRVMESMQDGVIAVDAAGRIEAWNPAAKALLRLGNPEGGPPGRASLEHVPAAEPLERALAGSSVVNEIYRSENADGSAYIAVTAQPLRDGEEQLGAVAVFSDITLQRRTEDQLRGMVEKRTAELEKRAKALEQANSELERFNRMAVGRELRMVDLKREVNALAERLGERPRYEIAEVEKVPAQ